MQQSLLQQPSHMVPNPSKPLQFLLCHFPGKFVESCLMFCLQKASFPEGKKTLKTCYCVLYLEGTPPQAVVRAGTGEDPREFIHI